MPVALSQDDREAWLARHAVHCQRYGMRLSPTSCEQHQAASPERCKGCERMTGEVPVVKQIKSSVARFPKRNQVPKGKVKDMAGKKPVRVCANCKETKPILGRGLCPGCYHKARKVEAMAAAPQEVAPAVDGANHPVDCMAVLFAGEDEMRAKIEAAARKERRDVRQQVLFYLDQVI